MKIAAKTVVVLGLLAIHAPLLDAQVKYNVTYLDNFSPLAMNSFAEVVGNINSKGVVYKNGHLEDLPTLGDASTTFATDINDKGEIVGSLNFNNGDSHAFYYSSGILNDIGNFGGKRGFAWGINNNGQIAVNVSNGQIDLSCQAFFYDTKNEATIEIGNLGGKLTVAKGINSLGEIVGYSTSTDGVAHAYLWNGNMNYLDPLGGKSVAESINDANQIAGFTYTDDREHAFIYNSGSMRDINGNNLMSTANAINNCGQVVGTSLNLENENFGFIYTDGKAYNLNSLIDQNLNLNIGSAVDINNSGRILVEGAYSDSGIGGAFLLTPIPEPSCFDLLAYASLITVYFFRSRRSCN